MASVTNTYARALADVVIDQQLDPGKTLPEVQSLASWWQAASNCGKSGKRLRSRRNRSAICWTRLWRAKEFPARCEILWQC